MSEAVNRGLRRGQGFRVGRFRVQGFITQLNSCCWYNHVRLTIRVQVLYPFCIRVWGFKRTT